VLLAGRGVTSILTRLQPIPTSSCTAKHDPVLELAVVQKQDWHASVQHVLPHYGSRPLIAETALLLLWERGRLFVGNRVCSRNLFIRCRTNVVTA
jgi:hypothetical protein